jgi:hypothetical protein
MPAGIARWLLGDDGDAKLRVNLGVEPDRHGMSSGRFDGMVQLYFAAVDLIALPAESIGDIL